MPKSLCMGGLRAQFGKNLRALREARRLTQEALAETTGLDRSYVGGIERGERNPTLTAVGRLAIALRVPPSSLFQGIGEDSAVTIPTRQGVSATERDGCLVVGFRYGQYDAEYVLNGARCAEYDEVVNTLKRGLASTKKSNADAVADAFLTAVASWPSANPSDIWTFVIHRMYCDPSNHPSDRSRLNLEQSWKRTSGWALERVLVRHYGPVLGRQGVSIELGNRQKKHALLSVVDDPRLVPDKADVLITSDAANDEKLVGVIHVKASIAERRTDDVPMSQALVEAGLLSVFWTMDSKSFPSTKPVNRGEFGDPEGKISDKRRDFEEHCHFSACFSYNANTRPTADKDAAARIFVCDFRDPDDQFSQFLIAAHRAVPSR